MNRLSANRVGFLSLILVAAGTLNSAELTVVEKVESQPLWAQARRVMEALEFLGNPLPEATKSSLQNVADKGDGAALVKAIQEAFDPHCLLGISINPESRVKVAQGSAAAQLVEQGWRQFLIKVHNEAGVTAELRGASPNALPLANSPQAQVADRWLEMQLFAAQPLTKNLSGLALEYRIVQFYSRDVGRREAKLSFNVGQGTQDLGFRPGVE